MLLVGAGLAAWSTQRTLETLRWVDHTREVRLELERMLVAVVGAEGALRGYLLTHDEAFRGSIERSLADATVALAAVDSLTRDNPEQQRRLREFSVLLTERSAAIRQQVTGDGPGAPTPDALRAMATIGRESLDESRRQVREMEELEDRLMEERAAAARRASSDTGI